MWTCPVCENSNDDSRVTCECCEASRPRVDYVPKPSMVEKPNPTPEPVEKKRPEPPPRTIPPLDIIEGGEFVDLSKSGHVYLTDDGKIGVPKGTRTKRTKTPPIPAPLEPTKKSITTPKKKRKKKKMSFDIFDFDRLKALYYLISIIFAVFVIMLMCLEDPNIIWIVLCLIGPVTYIILKIID